MFGLPEAKNYKGSDGKVAKDISQEEFLANMRRRFGDSFENTKVRSGAVEPPAPELLSGGEMPNGATNAARLRDLGRQGVSKTNAEEEL